MMWSLTSSEAIQTILKEKYKQQRHNDDENQPLSVQPWGVDGDKRRYFLIQGLDDTGFRVYREGSRYTRNAHWYSMAGEIDEVKALATKLEDVDRTQAARRLAGKITAAIPTFEATEEVSYSLNQTCMMSDADETTETPPQRIPSNAARSIYPTRARLLAVRRADTWQTYAVYLRR